MTSKRKSFVLHKDSLDILTDLTDEQAGKLFKVIYMYQTEQPFELDQITKMVFLPFKNQFTRDDEKYQETCQRRAIAGSKGGKQKVANASKCKQKVANIADSNSKNDSKSNSDSNNNICQQIADAYNSQLSELGKVITLSDKRKAQIRGCIKEFKNTDYDFEKIETWSSLFSYIQESDFLMGRKENWSANFDFIIKKGNLLKIIEGAYEN